MSVMDGAALLRTFGSRKKLYYLQKPESELKAGYYIRSNLNRNFLGTEEINDYTLVKVYYQSEAETQSKSKRGVRSRENATIQIICKEFPFSDSVDIGDLFVDFDEEDNIVKGFMVTEVDRTCLQSLTMELTLKEVD